MFNLAPAPGKAPEYADLLGIPFGYGGRGPDVFDCYGLQEELHRRLGQQIPDVRSPAQQALIADLLGNEVQQWTPCHRGPGAVLTFRIGRYISHVGMMLSQTQFIHTWEGARLGVAVERVADWERRITGAFRYIPTA